MNIRGIRGASVAIAIAAVAGACSGSTEAADATTGISVTTEANSIPGATGLCSAYLNASSPGRPLTRLAHLGTALDAEADTPPGVAVALETLLSFAGLSTAPGVNDEFTIDEAWGTIGVYVKPLCRPTWRSGVAGASSPLATATTFADALRAGDFAKLQSLGATNALAALDPLAGAAVDVGSVSTTGFELRFDQHLISCVFYEGFVDDCSWLS